MQRFFRKREMYGDVLLEPLHDEDREWLAKQKDGKQFKGDMRATRNPKHHRKAFALFKLIADNHPTYETQDEVLLEMKLRSHHYQEHVRAGNSRSANELRRIVMAHMDNDFVMHDMMEAINNLEREAKLVYMPKSISFDNMGQEEFEKLYDQWVNIGAEMIGVTDRELRRELLAFGE